MYPEILMSMGPAHALVVPWYIQAWMKMYTVLWTEIMMFTRVTKPRSHAVTLYMFFFEYMPAPTNYIISLWDHHLRPPFSGIAFDNHATGNVWYNLICYLQIKCYYFLIWWLHVMELNGFNYSVGVYTAHFLKSAHALGNGTQWNVA